MRIVSALPAMALVLASLPAHADSTYTFNLTDLSTGQNLAAFSLDPSTAVSPLHASDFSFANIAGTEDGVATTFSLNVSPGANEDYTLLVDADYNLSIEALFSPAFASGVPGSGGPVTFTDVTSLGFQQEDCDTELRSPLVKSDLPVALAFFQVRSPLVVNCGDSLSLSVGQNAVPVPPPPSTGVTPEPSSLCLLGTGVLCAAGVLRRRMRV